jgi:hypothetical protein
MAMESGQALVPARPDLADRVLAHAAFGLAPDAIADVLDRDEAVVHRILRQAS